MSEGLQPGDRVAIFTSEQMLVDFTSDADQIHDALLKLHSSSRSLTHNHDCPDLSDYQALQIAQDPSNKYSDAWQAALDEAAHCDSGSRPQSSPSTAGAPMPGGPPGAGNAGGGAGMGSLQQASGDAAGVVLQKARIMVEQIEMQTRSSLQQIEQAVKHVAQMPGQRTFILVSPGFLAQSDQYALDQIVDRALRAQVIINSLDPKGLANLLRESDASRAHVPDGAALRAAHSMDSQRELVATSVLADVAEGTGGQLFHNSNDLKGGFGLLAETPFYYTLAFAPNDIKRDGKFHELKVTLKEKEKGVSIQARRGYFAPKNNRAGAANADLKNPAPASTDAAILEQVREVILSKADITQIPADLVVKISDTPDATREVSLFSHLDTKSLKFRKDGDMNLNTVTFFFSVFDRKDNLVESQMRRARISVPDGRLATLFKVGLDVNLSFQLKPGTYRIREVLVESEERHMAAFSRSVTVP